jgi:hypothetical protein
MKIMLLGFCLVIGWGSVSVGAEVSSSMPVTVTSTVADQVVVPAVATITAFSERGLIIREDGIYPKQLNLTGNTPCSLWFVNGSGDSGTLTLQLSSPLVVNADKNEITELKITPLAPGDYTMQFKHEEKTLDAILHVGNEGNTSTVQETAIMAGFQKFKPEVTHLRANQPAVVYMYTAAFFIPHGDMEILGTEAKFKLKSHKMETVELKQGLAVGVYPISRPGYPQQNHGIKARVVAE